MFPLEGSQATTSVTAALSIGRDWLKAMVNIQENGELPYAPPSSADSTPTVRLSRAPVGVWLVCGVYAGFCSLVIVLAALDGGPRLLQPDNLILLALTAFTASCAVQTPFGSNQGRRLLLLSIIAFSVMPIALRVLQVLEIVLDGDGSMEACRDVLAGTWSVYATKVWAMTGGWLALSFWYLRSAQVRRYFEDPSL